MPAAIDNLELFGLTPRPDALRRAQRQQWTSSTGFTTVSKLKPHLPVQWAIGTHGKGSNRMKT